MCDFHHTAWAAKFNFQNVTSFVFVLNFYNSNVERPKVNCQANGSNGLLVRKISVIALAATSYFH